MDLVRLNDIIIGCRQNDRRSQKALYDQFYGYALIVALPYSSRFEEAREVVNDAFLKTFIGIDKYDMTLPFKAWFRVIVVRSAINYYHKHIEKIPLVELVEAQDIGFETDFIDSLLSDEVLVLLQKLPPSYRLALNLYVLEGYTHPEIAEMLSISVGASKSNLFKAKRELKILLQGINIYKNE
jgi:RNA polymerase sigma factor (sigma-70 family)